MAKITKSNPKGAGRKSVGRNERIQLTVSKEQKEILKKEAKENKTSLTSWILGKLFN